MFLLFALLDEVHRLQDLGFVILFKEFFSPFQFLIKTILRDGLCLSHPRLIVVLWTIGKWPWYLVFLTL